MRKITVDPCSKVIELGRYGENEATAVYLPLAEFQNYTPGGTVNVLVRRPDLGYPSPVEFTISEGYAVWNVGESFLAVEGYGKLELRYTVNGTRALGRVWNTHVGESIIPQGETAPDPFESWYEDIIEASEEAQEAAGNAATSARNASLSESATAESERQAGLYKDAAAQSAQNAGQSELAAQRYAEDAETAKEAIEDMTVSAETLEAGSEATVEKSIVAGVVNLKFGIPKGKDAENVISRDTRTNLNGILRGNGTNVDIQAVDNTPTENSNNLVTSDGVAKALQGKQDTLTFDSEPTSGSTNPVTSDGIFNSIVKVLPTATASGSTASFDDGADGVPVKSLVVDVEPVQAGSGDPSPDNVRPISGWTGANVTRAGKNLLPQFNSPQTYSNVTGTLTADGAIELSGTSSNIVYMILDSDFDTEKFAGCTLNSEVIANPNNVDVTKFNLRISSQLDFVQLQNCGINQDNTLVNNGKNRRLSLRFASANVNLTGVKIRVMLRKADKDATFEPSTSLPITCTWQSEAGTVYGGTLTINSDRTGTLVVDRKIVTENDNWVYGGSVLSAGGLHWYNLRGGEYPEGIVTGNICSMLVEKHGGSGWGSTSPCFDIGVDIFPVRVYTSETDIASFKAAYTGLQIVYRIKNTITYTLTATEISAILTTIYAQNNIWADTGDVTVTYRQDIGLALNKLNNAILSLGGNI